MEQSVKNVKWAFLSVQHMPSPDFHARSLYIVVHNHAIQKKSSLQTCNYAKGRNQRRNNANDSFGKGFDVLKDHVLNPLMTGRCPCISLQLRPKFLSHFLQNSFDFQKSATFKALKLSPRMYSDVSFNPENGAFSRMEKRVSE